MTATLTQTKPKTRPVVNVTKYAYATALAATLAIGLHLFLGQTVAGWSAPVAALLWVVAVLFHATAVKTAKR